jgi:hypothetical protein
MAADDVLDSGEGRADAGSTQQPARLRLPLRTMDDVKAELARLYREGKAGRRAIADVSKLANVLGILGRLIEGSELVARIETLEDANRRGTR